MDAARPIRYPTRYFLPVRDVIPRARSSAHKWMMEPFGGSGVLRADTSGPLVRLNLQTSRTARDLRCHSPRYTPGMTDDSLLWTHKPLWSIQKAT